MNPVRIHGGRAVPSMGLSQFRGGAAESESDEESVGGQMKKMVEGGGKKRVAKAMKRDMDEATAMGLHLGKHLHGLHGDDFIQKFGAGLVGAAMMCEGRGMTGAGFFDDIKRAFSPQVWDPQQNGVAAAFADFGQKVGHEITDPNSMLRGTILPAAAPILSAIPGLGSLASAASAAQTLNKGAKSVGLGKKGCGKLVITHGGASVSRTGRYEGEGMSRQEHLAKLGVVGEGFFDTLKDMGKKVVSEIARDPQGALDKAKKGYEMGKQVYGAVKGGKKKRAPAGPSDGRRKRAEIVKKVMAEKGCSMIEASKYVKAHGLY